VTASLYVAVLDEEYLLALFIGQRAGKDRRLVASAAAISWSAIG
jgi:hypothetical protein